jgi:hypothetical protein
MYKNHFYHNITKTAVAVFGSLFNDMTVIRKDGSGNTLNQIKVPLAYGPKQKFLSRLDEAILRDASLAIKMPRMSFEITSISYDAASKLSKFSSLSAQSGTSPNEKNVINQIVPYTIGFQLSILAKNQDDALQLLEQILPGFSPDYTVTIKPLGEFPDYKQDVPITLGTVTMSDEYEGDFVTRRVIVYTLDFEMKIKYFGPSSTRGVIKEVLIDFKNLHDDTLFEEMDIQVDPLTANENDDYDVTVTIG